MKKLLIIPIMLLLCLVGSAQTDMDQSLAIQFYQNQEYDKAADLFEKLYDKNPESNLYYRYLYNSLLYLKEYDKLQKIVKKAIKKNPEELSYQVDMGYLEQQMGDLNASKKTFSTIIKNLPTQEQSIRSVANAFIGYGEYELAAETYEAGRSQMKVPALFSFELADIYTRLNNKPKTIEMYLEFAQYNPGATQGIKNRLQDAIQDAEYAQELQNQLLVQVQKNGSNVFSELLIWLFIQKGDYKSAFIQARALDKRNNENGYRVIGLARAAAEARNYDAATEAYQYVIDKGRSNALYQTAKQELLGIRKLKVTTTYSYTQEDLTQLLAAYDAFITEFGLSRYTVNTLLEKAQLQAFYMHDLDSAIYTVESILKIPQLDKGTSALAKLELGDYYLLKGEDWESSLIYSQVDKAMGDEPLGEMARYKNAKLSYYQGEFEWAQAQLDILKASTSELIANDALNLSVFIMDNLGLDTTLYPMQKFASADLLMYQNRLDDALLTLDSVSNIFPNHSLADDILFKRAEIFLRKQDFEKAAGYFQQIIDQFPEDLLGDNATFKLAELYEFQLNDKDKAMQLYQDLIINYKDSVLVVEARKRFRNLRGDEL